LLLYLLEKYTNRETAILASKFFAIDIDRESQKSFAIFNGQKNHKNEAIKKAQEFIETYYNDKITVDQLTVIAAVRRRSFERRFKQATGNTVVEYIQRIKIEAAKRSLESSLKNITEVMFDVGNPDTKSLRLFSKKLPVYHPSNTAINFQTSRKDKSK